MSEFERIAKELGDLRRELREARAESRAGDTYLARAIRRGRVEVLRAEHEEAWRRLAPDISLEQWVPRAGKAPQTPDLSGSLVARLRAGDPVADSFGTSEPFASANVLTNPVLDSFAAAGPWLVAGVDTHWAWGWDGTYVLNSGTDPVSAISVYKQTDRSATSLLFNSSLAKIKGTPTAAADVSVYVYDRTYWEPGYDAVAPFLVASAKVTRTDVPAASVTTLRVRMEITDATGTLLAAGEWLDLLALETYDTARIVTSVSRPGGGWGPSKRRVWQMRVDMVVNGTTVSGPPSVSFGEPSLALSSTPDAPPYTPLVGKWDPPRFKVHQAGDDLAVYTVTVDDQGRILWDNGNGVAGATNRLWQDTAGSGTLNIDTQIKPGVDMLLRVMSKIGRRTRLELSEEGVRRLGLSGDATLTGFEFGGGSVSSADLRAFRAAAGELDIDAGSGAYDLLVRLVAPSAKRGRLAGRVSGDTYDRVVISADATLAGLEFGPGNAAADVNLYRDAPNVLRTDDALRADNMAPQHTDWGGGSVNVVVTTHLTYYYTGVEQAFTPLRIGQRYEIAFSGSIEMSAGVAQYALARIDVTDNSNTFIATLGYCRVELTGAGGYAPGTAFHGYWTADAVAIRKIRLMVTLQTDDGKTVYVDYGQITVVPTL